MIYEYIIPGAKYLIFLTSMTFHNALYFRISHSQRVVRLYLHDSLLIKYDYAKTILITTNGSCLD